MRVNHGRSYRGRARVLVVLGGVLWLGLIGQARAFSGNINATSVPGWTPAPGGGTVMPSAEVRWANSVAKTAAIVEAAGRSIAVEVAFTRTAAAGRAVTAACFANPAVCAVAAGAIGIAAWYAASNIVQDEATNQYQVVFDSYGWIYRSMWGPISDQTFASRSAACDASARSYCVAAAGYCGVHSYSIRTPAPVEPGDALCDFKCDKLTGYPAQCSIVSGVVTHSIDTMEGVTQETRPATQADHEAHADTHPMPDSAANESPVPVPVVQPDIVSEPTPVGDTYPGDDTPNEGPWKQDTERVADIPETADPTDVEVTPETKDADNPNTDEDETPPVEDPNPPTEEVVNQCDLNPDSVGCALVGTAPTDEVPKDTSSISWQWSPLGLPIGCPAPIPTPHGDLSFQPVCDAAVLMSPLVQALGAFSALMICIAAIRRA